MFVVCVPTFSNIFCSETGPIEENLYVKLPWDGGTNVCSNGSGYMTNMAVMPMYDKKLKNSSSPEPRGR